MAVSLSSFLFTARCQRTNLLKVKVRSRYLRSRLPTTRLRTWKSTKVLLREPGREYPTHHRHLSRRGRVAVNRQRSQARTQITTLQRCHHHDPPSSLRRDIRHRSPRLSQMTGQKSRNQKRDAGFRTGLLSGNSVGSYTNLSKSLPNLGPSN